jgi:hypothetical protein
MKYWPPFGNPDPDAAYLNGNPAIGVQGSIPDCRGYEGMMRDNVNLIKAAGFAPTDADVQQIARSVRQGVNYIVATQIGGNANTLTCANTGDVPTLTSLPAGLRLFVHIPANNTGATTLVIDGMAAVSIVRANGADLSADDLRGGMIAALVSDGTKLQIENFQGFTSSTTNNNTYTVNIPYIADTGAVNVVTAVFAPPLSSQAAGLIVCVKLGHTLTGPSTITVNALATKPIVRPDGSPTQLNDAFIGEMLLLSYDGTSYQIINQIGVLPPATLLANADWYVNTGTGHDTNYDGTSATVSGVHGPFKTIGKAITNVNKYNMNGYNQSIHVADGTYTESLSLGPQNGSGVGYLIGNVSTPANCIIQGVTSRSGVTQGGGNWGMDGFRVNSGTGPGIGDEMSCITIQGGTFVPGRLHFGAASSTHFRVSGASSVSYIGSVFTVFGDAAAHIGVGPGGTIQTGTYAPNLPSVVISNPISLQTWISANSGGVAQVLYSAITGAGNVSGAKFVASLNGVINSNGNGINYYPGNSAGITQSGGQYT